MEIMNLELVPMLAAISGDTLIQALIWLVIAGIIIWILWWALNTINPPEPFKKVGTVVIVLITVIILINILLSLVGKPIFKF